MKVEITPGFSEPNTVSGTWEWRFIDEDMNEWESCP